MAPFGTTSTAILATTTAIICLAVVAPPVVSSGKSFDRPHRRHYDPQRQSCSTKTPTNRARPVVAWGHRRSRGTTDRIQQQHTDNDGRGFTSYDGDDIDAGSDGGGWMDPSWTHAAFRAFHELRAGRPQQTYVEDVSEDVTRGAEDGPGRRLQRQLSSLMQARFTGAPAVSVANEEAVGVTTISHPPPKPACWHMKGRLTSTATGRTIALVEGVELSRSLAFEVASNTRKQKTQGRGTDAAEIGAGSASTGGKDKEELEVDKALRSETWTAFGALASSKFFMYQNPDTGEPMEYFRHTPVDKRQPVRTYECFSQIVSHLLKQNGRILAVSEWGGRSVKAQTANIDGVDEIGGDEVGGRGGGSSASNGGDSLRRVFNLHFFVEPRTPKEARELIQRQNRPGAKWVAFGATPPRTHGCKEIYSYVTGGEQGGGTSGRNRDLKGWGMLRSMSLGVLGGKGSDRKEALVGDPDAKGMRAGRGTGGLMTYTRYGECPSWYGTGQMCGLDVQAKRVGSFSELPAKLRERVLEVDPDFESGPPGSLEECRARAALEREAREEERRKKRRSWRQPFGIWDSGDD